MASWVAQSSTTNYLVSGTDALKNGSVSMLLLHGSNVTAKLHWFLLVGGLGGAVSYGGLKVCIGVVPVELRLVVVWVFQQNASKLAESSPTGTVAPPATQWPRHFRVL